MPGHNGTGPQGMGPKTGRGTGRCIAGTGQGNMVEFGNQDRRKNDRGPGRRQQGRGRRRGMNRGSGNQGRPGNR